VKDFNLLLWGGDITNSEPYQVSAALRCTTFPFIALIAHTPQGMAVVSKIQGASCTPTSIVRKFAAAIDAYSPDIDRIRAQRAAQEADRAIRQMQEDAYQASLAVDRARAEKRREEARKAEEIEMTELKREEWRRWRRRELREEPDVKGSARVSIRLADGERVVRRFDKNWSIEEVYAFVETREVEGWENASKPKGYEHEYRFRVCGVMPRKVFSDTEETIEECGLWPSGNLVVEEVDDESDEE
jgi:FAS-associated factor 2